MTDVAAVLARLSEQTTGLQRQVFRLEARLDDLAGVHRQDLDDLAARVTALTEAKFVTYRTLIDSQAEKVKLALDAADKAVSKSEASMEKRFDAVNEFRGQLADQARTFMPRTEAIQLADQATQRIRELAELVPTLATRMEVQVTADRYTERIGELNDRVTEQGTRLTKIEEFSRGAQGNRAGLYAALSVATAVIIAIVVVINLVTAHTP